MTAAGGEGGSFRAWAGRVGCPYASMPSASWCRLEWETGKKSVGQAVD